MSEAEIGFEHTQLRGITVKNMIVTVICTGSLMLTVAASYYGLKNQNDINDLRIRVTEARITVLEQEIRELQAKK